MRMKIKRIEKLNKAIDRYDQLIDETERKKFIQIQRKRKTSHVMGGLS